MATLGVALNFNHLFNWQPLGLLLTVKLLALRGRYDFNIQFGPSIINSKILEITASKGHRCVQSTLAGRDEVAINTKEVSLKYCIIASNGTVTLNTKEFKCVNSYIKASHVIFNELESFNCNDCLINVEHTTFNTDYIDLTDTVGCYFTGSVSFMG